MVPDCSWSVSLLLGYYCLANTARANQYPCPRGTFNNVTGASDDSYCQPCLGGMYCDQDGLAEPAGYCDAGYYCTSGSNSSSPSLGVQADECTTGHYCPMGSVTPQACPPGTYNSATQRQDVSECTNCTGGRYCPSWSMTAHGALCDAGEALDAYTH